MWPEIKKIIQEKERFVLTTHINPDGDGLGAACALIELLLKMQKKVRFICDSPIPRKFTFLDFHQLYQEYSPSLDLSKEEALIVLDTHKKERIGALSKLADLPSCTSICIDHHEKEGPSFTPYTCIDTKACSVGAMIYRFYKEWGYSLNLEAATGIYTSILCDTERFSNGSTDRKAHKIADECMKLGVDPDRMHSRVFHHLSLAEMKMFANVLQHMETYLDNRVLIQEIRREDYLDLGEEIQDIEHLDLDTFLELNKQVENVACVILLREISDHQVRVSLRANEDLNLAQILETWGGGGHPRAAGLTWHGSLQEVKVKILDKLEKLLSVAPVAVP